MFLNLNNRYRFIIIGYSVLILENDQLFGFLSNMAAEIPSTPTSIQPMAEQLTLGDQPIVEQGSFQFNTPPQVMFFFFSFYNVFKLVILLNKQFFCR